MKQNKEALLFFFSLGFLSIFFQTSLLKEIVWIFYGNEMFYGLGLGFWMLSAGIGSFYWKKMEKYFSILKINLWVILFSLVLLNLFLVIFWRLVEAKIVVTGEIPGFFPLALIIFVSLFLFCFCLGMLFPRGVSNFKNRIKEAYFGETIGFLLGGILISIFTYKTFFPLNKSVEIWSLKFKFPKIEDVVKTKFNKILIIGKDSQKNFLTNGQVIFSSDQNYESEKRTSLIIPFSKKLNNVLVINSISMANSIIQNYPEKEVYLLENDLELVKLLEKEKGFIDFRTKILKEDAREFLRTSSKKWDLIALWGNTPQSLVENRFLTYEFFQNIQGKLADKGVFAFCFSFPSYYQGKEIFSFGKVIYQTIKEIFPFVKIICDEDFLIIIGSSERIDYNPEKILPKWQEYFFIRLQIQKIRN